MRRNKGQSPIQYVTVILVIVALVGSWMAYSSAGPASTEGLAEKKDVSSLKNRIATLEKRIKTLEEGQSSIMEKVGVTPPARISVASVSAPPVKVGEEATITVSVINTGGESGTKDITLKVAGEPVDTKTVTVAAGSSKTVPFDVMMDKVGDYMVTALGSSTEWSVKSKAREKVTLHILGGAGPEAKAWLNKDVLSLYEKTHPYTKIETDIIPKSEVWTKTKMFINQNRCGKYDIIYTEAGGWLRATNNNFQYTPVELDLINENFAKQVPSGIKEMYKTENGRYMAWPPTHFNYHVMFYREDLFNNPEYKKQFKSKYGYELRPPKTWEEFADVAEFFTRPEEDLYGTYITGSVGWSVECGLPMILLMSNQGYYVINPETGKVDLTNPQAIEAWKYAKKLTQYCPQGWKGTDWFTGLRWFKQGKIAMHIQWDFPWGDFFNKEEVSSEVYKNVNVARVPTAPATGKAVVRTSGHGWMIPKVSDNPKRAAEFLRWWQNFEPQKKIAMTGKVFRPPRTDVNRDPDVKEVLKTEKRTPYLYQGENEVLQSLPPKYYLNRPSVGPLMGNAWEKFMTGEWSAKEALSWLETKLSEKFKGTEFHGFGGE